MANLGLKIAVLFIALGAAPCAAQMFSAGETSFVKIKAVDAEVLRNRNGKVSMGAEQRCGQGVIIDPSGIIVTNKHVVGDLPQYVYVTLADGKTLEAEVVRNSLKDDLAFLKIDAPFPLRAMALGDSSQVQIGNRVFAFANAALDSQRERSGEVVQVYREASSDAVAILQVNIPLKPGDSGGAIVNEQGLLMGLIMANQISDRSKSYAIAANRIQQEYFQYRNSILN